MTKKNKTPLGIFTESIGLYFSNFDKFVKYMSFPVLGQIAGLLIVFVLVFFYTKYMPYLMQKIPFFDNFSVLVLCAILVTLPGLIIFIKAFWEYLVAYGAVNSMLENMLKSGKVYDFDAHTELIKRRTLPFVGLWLLYSIFVALASFPLLWVLGGIFFIYFILIFQVFTFEEDLSVGGYFRKSFDLIRGNFARTVALVLILVVLTFYLIPMGFNVVLDILNLRNLLTDAIIPFVSNLPLDSYNQMFSTLNIPPVTPDMLAKSILEQSVFLVAFGFTLPLRSICWTLWYKILGEKKDKKSSKKSGK